MGLIVQANALPRTRAFSRHSLLNTGNAPGCPVQTGQMCVFGRRLSKFWIFWHWQKSFVVDLSLIWISSQTVICRDMGGQYRYKNCSYCNKSGINYKIALPGSKDSICWRRLSAYQVFIVIRSFCVRRSLLCCDTWASYCLHNCITLGSVS